MMQSGSVKLHGFDELDRAFAKVRDEAKGKVLRSSLSKGAAVIRDAARRNAKAILKEPGTFPNRIRLRYVRNSPYSAQYNIVVAKPKGKVAGVRKRMEASAWWIEYGTGTHPPGGKGEYWVPKKEGRIIKFVDKRTGKEIIVGRFRHPGMKARPFMRPAFDRHKDEAIRVFGSEFGKLIELTFKEQGLSSWRAPAAGVGSLGG